MEFQVDDVARIVAETMNNYLMFDKLLKCKCFSDQVVRPYLMMCLPHQVTMLRRRGSMATCSVECGGKFPSKEGSSWHSRYTTE